MANFPLRVAQALPLARRGRIGCPGPKLCSTSHFNSVAGQKVGDGEGWGQDGKGPCWNDFYNYLNNVFKQCVIVFPSIVIALR